MKHPDFAVPESHGNPHAHYIKIIVSGRIPSPRGWVPWCERYWIPKDRLQRIADRFHGVRDIKIKTMSGDVPYTKQ